MLRPTEFHIAAIFSQDPYPFMTSLSSPIATTIKSIFSRHDSIPSSNSIDSSNLSRDPHHRPLAKAGQRLEQFRPRTAFW